MALICLSTLFQVWFWGFLTKGYFRVLMITICSGSLHLAGGLLIEMSISKFEKYFFLLRFDLFPNTCPVVRPHICNWLLCGNEFLDRVFGMFLKITSASIQQHLCSYLAMGNQSLISQGQQNVLNFAAAK